MIKPISTIFFDVGGTLRRNIARDQASRAVIVQQILDLLGSDTPADEFSHTLADRAEAYEDWAAQSLIELDENRLWTDWMLPDYPASQIAPRAMDFNRIWREAICTRVIFHDTVQAITELHHKNYRLGVVSNTTSSIDAPSMLATAGISHYFEETLLSCVFGRRKPDPAILVEAATRMGVPTSECAYVGDRLDWDVGAARRACFGMAILRRTEGNPEMDSLRPDLRPDYFIDSLAELLPLFPPR